MGEAARDLMTLKEELFSEDVLDEPRGKVLGRVGNVIHGNFGNRLISGGMPGNQKPYGNGQGYPLVASSGNIIPFIRDTAVGPILKYIEGATSTSNPFLSKIMGRGYALVERSQENNLNYSFPFFAGLLDMSEGPIKNDLVEEVYSVNFNGRWIPIYVKEGGGGLPSDLPGELSKRVNFIEVYKRSPLDNAPILKRYFDATVREPGWGVVTSESYPDLYIDPEQQETSIAEFGILNQAAYGSDLGTFTLNVNGTPYQIKRNGSCTRGDNFIQMLKTGVFHRLLFPFEAVAKAGDKFSKDYGQTIRELHLDSAMLLASHSNYSIDKAA